MSVQIPTGDGTNPFFSLQAVLDDVTYTLEFRWNERLVAWFMSVFDAEGTTQLMMGVRVVADWTLGAYFTGAPFTGLIIASDTSGQGLDPGFADLGDRVKLFYFSQAELTL